MSNYTIYFSPTGGTKKVADLLSEALFGETRQIDLCRDIEPMTLGPEDVCLINVPSYGGRVPGIALKRLKAICANGAKAILVCVYGNREWDDALTELQDTLESIGFVCAAAVAAVAEHSIFRQYAAGRPDTQDAAELARFAGKSDGTVQSNDSEFSRGAITADVGRKNLEYDQEVEQTTSFSLPKNKSSEEFINNETTQMNLFINKFPIIESISNIGKEENIISKDEIIEDNYREKQDKIN